MGIIKENDPIDVVRQHVLGRRQKGGGSICERLLVLTPGFEYKTDPLGVPTKTYDALTSTKRLNGFVHLRVKGTFHGGRTE